MKKWTGFIVCIVILILAAYYAIGFFIENTLNTNVNSIPKNSAFSVHLDQYHRGWFSSQAIVTTKMHIPAQSITDKNGATKTEPPADMNIDIPILIKHGPFIFTAYGIRFGTGLVTTQPETHYEAFINYLNKIIFRYTLPSFAMESKIGQNEGDFKLNWQGLTSLLCVSSNLDHIDGNLGILGIKGASNNPSNIQSNLSFEIGKIASDFQFKQYQEWLWLGHSRFDIPSIAITLAGEKVFELAGFDFLAGSNVTTDNTMNIDLKLSLQKLFVNNQSYGQGLLHLNLRNLDPVIAAKINQEFNLTQNNSDPHLFTQAFITELPKLLAKGAVLELSEMTLDVPDGKITGNFKISAPKSEGDELSQLMQKMYGEGNFKAPIKTIKALVTATIKNDRTNNTQTTPNTQGASPNATNPKQIPNAINPIQILTNPDTKAANQAEKMLQNFVSKGLLKIEGNDYVLTFKIENQKIIVNGQPFNPDMLK